MFDWALDRSDIFKETFYFLHKYKYMQSRIVVWANSELRYIECT